MASDYVQVTIEGAQGTDFQIIPRTRTTEPPPPILEASLNADGRAVAFLPRGSYVLRRAPKGYKRTARPFVRNPFVQIVWRPPSCLPGATRFRR